MAHPTAPQPSPLLPHWQDGRQHLAESATSARFVRVSEQAASRQARAVAGDASTSAPGGSTSSKHLTAPLYAGVENMVNRLFLFAQGTLAGMVVLATVVVTNYSTDEELVEGYSVIIDDVRKLIHIAAM